MEERYGEILIYQTEDGLTNINVKMQDETVCLTQQQLVDLYQSSKANVSEHIEHRPMYMSDYVEQLDSVLASGNRKLLCHQWNRHIWKHLRLPVSLLKKVRGNKFMI